MNVSGVFHVHSSFSHDGKHNLRELADLFKAQDIDFCIVTDHLSDHNEKSFQRFLDEVKDINDAGDFLFIPGAEAEFERAHIVAFPLDAMPDTSNIESYGRAEKCMRVLAHPSKLSFTQIEALLSQFEGYELWNQWADGNGLPSYSFVQGASNTEMFKSKIVFWGTDMHDGSMPACNRLVVDVPDNSFDTDTIVSQLRSGQFLNVNLKSNLAMEATQPVNVLLEQISRKRAMLWCLQSAFYSLLHWVFSALGTFRKCRMAGFLKMKIKKRL